LNASVLRRFGFPNLKALEDGLAGTECRGEEHEVVIVWSITSGKRQIIMDGREIHFSANRTGMIDFSWNAKGNHVFKTICHATPPLSPQPGFRQYDLFIDGQSFFRMPKLYELGVKGVSAQENRIPGQYNSYDEQGGYSARSAYDGGGGGYVGGYGGGGYGNEPSTRASQTSYDEDAELQRAIKASLEDAKSHLGETSKSSSGPPDVLSDSMAPASTTDLLGFDDPVTSPYAAPAISGNPSLNSFDGGLASGYGAPPTQPYLALPSTQPATNTYGAPPAQPSPYGAPPSQQYGAPAAPQQFPALPPSSTLTAYGAPPAPAYAAPITQPQYPPAQPQYQFPAQAQPTNQFGPVYNDDPFAPKPPTHRDVASGILKAYNAGGSAPAAGSTNGVGYGAPPPPGYYQPGQPFMPNEAPPGSYGESNGTYGPTLSMNSTLTLTETESVDQKPQNPFEAALKKLVNFDHIDEPAEEQLKLTMKQQEDERQRKLKSKSAPLPPAASRVVGSGATLREIATVKPPTKREIVMKPPPHLFQGDAAMAGAMVEYGAPPPPLQPRGFGVVHMQGQYAAQPPPPQQGYGYGYR
jgi:hypothetical protein